MPPGGGCEEEPCHCSCTPSGVSRCLLAAITSIAPHRLPRQNRRGSKELVASDARSDRPLRWSEHRAQHPHQVAEPAEKCHPSFRSILLPMLPVRTGRCSLLRVCAGESGRRGPCDGCEQGRDVPVGVTASSEYRGCLREVVAKKSLPLLLHPLRCVTMLVRSHHKHRAPPAPPPK